MKEALGSSETSFIQEPHGLTSQKTPFLIFTAVKTSKLKSTLLSCGLQNNLLAYDVV
jgi:hypothetical protein